MNPRPAGENAQMIGNLDLGDVARAGSGGVEEGPPGPTHPVDDLLGEQLATVLLVEFPIPDVGDDPFPAPAQPDYLEALPDRPDRDGPDCRVEAGNVPSPSQDADGSFFSFHDCHTAPLSCVPVMPDIGRYTVSQSFRALPTVCHVHRCGCSPSGHYYRRKIRNRGEGTGRILSAEKLFIRGLRIGKAVLHVKEILHRIRQFPGGVRACLHRYSAAWSLLPPLLS